MKTFVKRHPYFTKLLIATPFLVVLAAVVNFMAFHDVLGSAEATAEVLMPVLFALVMCGSSLVLIQETRR